MKENETIFFAVFNSGEARHDRREYFGIRKTLKEFDDWIEKCRKEIEKNKEHRLLSKAFNS